MRCGEQGMCGIVGVICQDNFNSFKKKLPEAASHLFHRDPDDSGLFLIRSSVFAWGTGGCRSLICPQPAVSPWPATIAEYK